MLNLTEMLLTVKKVRDERPKSINTLVGTHGITYGKDINGEYAIIGLNFPPFVYAEIEDGEYGCLQGLRIYLDEEHNPLGHL